VLVIFVRNVLPDFKRVQVLCLHLVQPAVDVHGRSLDAEDERTVADDRVGPDEGEIIGHVWDGEVEIGGWEGRV
jgi:hypothetical protein